MFIEGLDALLTNNHSEQTMEYETPDEGNRMFPHTAGCGRLCPYAARFSAGR